ncbi:extracellular calcium-sensing receptor-like [Dendropsophus ebraccatus]|uniref:extracellular calcium-sensing receptor-like n=1 Tax=Dendropsophus ebraccatus TaxID=150705 RepID=UPI003831F17D
MLTTYEDQEPSLDPHWGSTKTLTGKDTCLSRETPHCSAAGIKLAESKMRLYFHLYVMTLTFRSFGTSTSGCSLSIRAMADYTEKGDITLGLINAFRASYTQPVATFSKQPPLRPCDWFNTDSYKSILALIFAVEEVNDNPDLLPNITLGFQMFDSCFSESASVQAVFQSMSSNGNQTPNYKCGSEPIVPAIIGDVSTSSVAMARVLGLWRFPQVSYMAALPSLSSKFEFPSFTRTTVSTRSQPQALIELCKKFRWTWIGVVVSSTDYFIQGVVEFRREAIKSGICIEFLEIVTFNPIHNRIPKTMEIVSRATARVVILYCTIAEIFLLFHEILQENMNRKVWIGTEAWYTIPPIDKQFWTILNGTIGIARSRNISPNFSNYLKTFHPSKYPRMIFVETFWEVMFTCKWPEAEVNNHFINVGHVNVTCTGLEKVVTSDVAELNDPTSLFVYMAHNAVYAIAHALHNLLHCSPGEGPFHGGSCANKQDLQPWQLLHYLRRVHFVNTAEEDVSFDANGDIYGHFDMMNWHLEDNRRQFSKVGIFNDYLDEKLSINDSAIVWAGGQGPEILPPHSASWQKLPCLLGSLRWWDNLPAKLLHKVKEALMLKAKNSAQCFSCPQDLWPNRNRTKCAPKVVEFLSYAEPLGLVLASLSITFSITTMMVLIVFIRFRNTTVVKANNRNLSYVLLLSLMLCFLCSFVFIGCPVKLTCSVRQSLFGFIFSLCISCILAKTIIVVIAFKATKPGSNLRVWIGSKTAILVVSMSTSVQVLIILVWQIEFTPYLERNYGVLLGVILLECNEGWVVMFYCTIGYLAFLATISFVVAFLARNLPDSFNEAKYITFSMLTFLSVWSTFIPAYLSTKGKYIVAVEIFAILLSSFGLLCCIFGPKCYIILLRPSMNTKQYLMSKG